MHVNDRSPRRSRFWLAVAFTLTLCVVAASGQTALAYTPTNRPETSPATQDMDRPVPRPAEAVLGRWWELGPIGGTSQLALASMQSELSIAASGNLVVIGQLDNRFGVPTVAYSTDGGLTFTDGGPVPLGTVGLGDPVLAVYNAPSGPPVFYYARIVLSAASIQTLAVARSTDGGITWTPSEVTSATISGHLADKEWISVDAETGRLFVSWTDFPPAGVTSINVTYSDDQGATWSPAVPLGENGQGSSIATDPNGPYVYNAWHAVVGSATTLMVARSLDNGATWLPAVAVEAYNEVIAPYGFDRFNSFPSLCVNPLDGGVEVVHPASQNGTPDGDFADVYYRRSSDHGATWGPSQVLNARPGSDRAQAFPTVAATTNGRIDVFWYDESAGSGVDDMTDLFYTYSNDFGATWSSPVPVNPSPWHNESGNDFSTPHQGDYIDATYNQFVTSAYGAGGGFAPPDPLGTGADAFVATVAGPAPVCALRVRPGAIGVLDHGCGSDDGYWVADEIADLTIPLENFGRDPLTGISATISALSGDVTVYTATELYPNLPPGASAPAASPFVVALASLYPCGQDARFRLDISAAGCAPTYVEFSLRTGIEASRQVLLSENFDGVTPPAIPAGWVLRNPNPACTTNDWITTNLTAMSKPNAAFCADIATCSFGRLFGPAIAIPAGVTYVDVAFDISYDFEALDARLGFDGASFEYQLDGVGTNRFGTSDAIDFEYRYTHRLVRASGGSAFGDRSGWSGASNGWQHVRLRIPDLAGHSLTPRLSCTTDASVGGTGVYVDNVTVTAITMDCGTCQPTTVRGPELADAGVQLRAGAIPFARSTILQYTLSERVPVRLEVFAADGRHVRTLVQGLQGPGDYDATFDLHSPGPPLAPGVYIVRLKAGPNSRTLRVVALD